MELEGEAAALRKDITMEITLSGIEFDPEKLSDVPARWSEATVIRRYGWGGIARRVTGPVRGFLNSDLCRDRTYIENTQVGMMVWICEHDGGISAHPPDPRSPRQQYRDRLAAQVQQLSDAIDQRAADEILGGRAPEAEPK